MNWCTIGHKEMSWYTLCNIPSSYMNEWNEGWTHDGWVNTMHVKSWCATHEWNARSTSDHRLTYDNIQNRCAALANMLISCNVINGRSMVVIDMDGTAARDGNGEPFGDNSWWTVRNSSAAADDEYTISLPNTTSIPYWRMILVNDALKEYKREHWPWEYL